MRIQRLTAVGLLLAAGVASAQPVENTPRLRPLDFTPFSVALEDFTDDRSAAIAALLRDASIPRVQAGLDAGAFTSVELTLFFLERIRTYDETYRTFVELNPSALAEAAAADAVRASGARHGAMLGIPISIKDNIETAGPMHTTGGAEILLDHVASADAPLVANLREAGAVILGKANLSELAGVLTFEHPGFSAVGGQTRNPHGLRFPTSGSSSGSAAATAGLFAMASIGTETAGSIIAPASSTGIVGLFPGAGLVDVTGVIPLISGNDAAGPLGRSVTDVAILLATIGTADTDYLAALDPRALAGARAGIFASDIAAGSRDADTGDNPDILQRLIDALEAAGAVVAEVEDPTLRVIGNGLGVLIPVAVASETLPYLAAAGAPATTLDALIAYNEAQPERRIPMGQSFLLTYPDAARVIADAGGYESAVAELHALAVASIEGDFAATDADVLVSLANYHSALYATAHYPAITVPFGLRENGAPVGATFIGRPGEEAILLSYAYAFEQATHLRVTPDL